MCDFITPTVAAVMSISAAAVSAYATHESAKAQQESEREEVHSQAEEELGQRIRQQRERRARDRVAAGESGALGASFAASMNQSLADTDMDAALISKNSAFKQRGIDDRAAVALSQIRDPSALEAGLQIASAGAAGYRTGLGIQNLSTAETTSQVASAAGNMSPVANPPPTTLWPPSK